MPPTCSSLGHPPRVLANAGIAPEVPVVHVSAFADRDGPGYGPAAEAHGGWAARHDPPRLARTSVADPVAGLVAALTRRAPADDRRVVDRAGVARRRGRATPRTGATR